MDTLHKKISAYVSDRQKKEEVQERLDEQKRDTIQPGDKVFVKVFRRKWYNERREGPFEVVRSTGTAVQVKGSPTWYHFSHCVKAPSDELPCSQSHDEGSKQSEGNLPYEVFT
uniref:Murine leukemia virus integrase C-terminal domain-containing protein n=1 Tax=Pygocentrus nattereri TaxID=42514 RepID=A0AAR2M0L0_PYGNA